MVMLCFADQNFLVNIECLQKKSTRGRFFAIVTYRFFNYDQQYTSQYLYYNVGLYVLIYTYHIIL